MDQATLPPRIDTDLDERSEDQSKEYFITIGEKRLLERRRMRRTQSQLARQWQTSRKKLHKAERETEIAPKMKLTTGERMYLMRRRTGILQKDIALELGVSAALIRMMEQDKVDPTRLVNYWTA